MALDSPAPPTRATEPDDLPPDTDEETAAVRDLVAEQSAPPPRGPSGRDLLPDIEEINSTLRATTDRSTGDFSTTDIESMDRRPRRRRGFRIGFFLVLLVAGAAVGAYVFAPEITAALPQAEPYLTDFVQQVDDLRLWLDDLVQSLVSQLAAMAGG